MKRYRVEIIRTAGACPTCGHGTKWGVWDTKEKNFPIPACYDNHKEAVRTCSAMNVAYAAGYMDDKKEVEHDPHPARARH